MFTLFKLLLQKNLELIKETPVMNYKHGDFILDKIPISNFYV